MTVASIEDIVVEVLQADGTAQEIADRVGKSRDWVLRVRIGRRHPHIRPDIPRRGTPRHGGVPKRKLTREQVLDIFYSSETLTAAAAKHGVKRQTASDIRRGRSYKDITAPESRKRPTGLLCQNCRFYDGAIERTRNEGQRIYHLCNLEMPEIKRHGTSWANSCSYYLDDHD